jgi:hypothetical protein
MVQTVDTRKRISRLRKEAFELARRYGNVRFDEIDGSWLFVEGFKLPRGWNKDQVNILIDVPWGSPGYPSVAPQWFWTDNDLKTSEGSSIGHFFTAGGSGHTRADYVELGWGHFCIHMNEWRPAGGIAVLDGHSLITYLDLIRAVFNDRRRLAGL